ncbi:MAG: Hsp20 family protein [Pseudomonadota bacterium]
MTKFDLSPLYRTAIGFDRLAETLSSASRVDSNGYPPYNIESLGDDQYRITMAVAGFGPDELDIQSERNTLTVTGAKQADNAESQGEFLYRGIATRSFERRFQLADYVEVSTANLENGLLHIELKRELPEQMKPRKIEIGGSSTRVIESESKAEAA